MKYERFFRKFSSLSDRDASAIDLDIVVGGPRSGSGQFFYRAFGKRLIDLILVFLSAPLIITVLLPLTLMVALDGSNPFYSQLRVGRAGRLYRMWKLRSMVPDADKLLLTYLKYNPEAKAEWDRDQKLKNDPRITKVGRFIRRASLDELPQFWNVLLGDMSIVGPRPMLQSQRHLYPGADYYMLRPGITGFWQISARNESSFADRAHFDSGYNSQLSFKRDLKILLATVTVVLSGTGH